MCGMHMDFAYENQLAILLQLVDSCIHLVTWVKKPFRWPAMIKRTAQLQRKEEKYAFCSSIGRTSRRWMCLSSLNSKATSPINNSTVYLLFWGICDLLHFIAETKSILFCCWFVTLLLSPCCLSFCGNWTVKVSSQKTSANSLIHPIPKSKLYPRNLIYNIAKTQG